MTGAGGLLSALPAAERALGVREPDRTARG